jgi:hypothetical protein
MDDRPPHNHQEEVLDRIAWRILTDLFRGDAGFESFPQQGLQHMIGLRLVQEARKAQVPPEALAQAFDRAWAEFSGRNRPPVEPADDDDSEPPERIEDL